MEMLRSCCRCLLFSRTDPDTGLNNRRGVDNNHRQIYVDCCRDERWRDGKMEGDEDTGMGKLEQLCFMFDIVIGFALGLADVVNSK